MRRPEFLRMIRMCKQGKVDMILTKSIARFACNTVYCLNHIRLLRSLVIGVFFEKQNINSFDEGSEIFITMYGAFAQEESKNIRDNVQWGKRQAMREGRTTIEYKNCMRMNEEKTGNLKSSRNRMRSFERYTSSIWRGQCSNDPQIAARNTGQLPMYLIQDHKMRPNREKLLLQ